MTPTTTSKAVNAILYQIGWFMCMSPVNEVLSLLFAASTYLVFCIMIQWKPRVILFTLASALLGYGADRLCELSGIIDLSPHGDSTLYLIALWLMFVTTFEFSLNFIFTKWYLATGMGALAPIAYYAGEKLGKVAYTQDLKYAVPLHASSWVIVTTTIYLVKTHVRLNNREQHIP